MEKVSVGAPGQFVTARAPAKWMKSPGVMLWNCANGFSMFTISSRPMFGWKLVSMVSKVMMDPSAPLPLQSSLIIMF